jgi:hypothetical protein
MENLLDIDFDGAAPAATAAASTPQRAVSPGVPSAAAAGGMADLMGLGGGEGQADLINGFAAMGVNEQPPPPQTQLNGGGKQTNEDLLGLF